MKLVRKVKPHSPVPVLRELTNNEANALYWALLLGKGRADQRQLACQLAEYLQDQVAWVQCDCRETQPPLMTLVMNAKGGYHLRHMNARGEHEAGCRFKEVVHAKRVPSGKIVNKPCNPSTPWHLHRRGHIEPSKRKRTQSSGQRHSSTRYPRLARVLYTLIEAAQLNQLKSGAVMPLKTQYQRLKQQATAFELHPGVIAAEYLFTYPNLAAMTRLLEQRAGQWPRRSRPHALCLTVVDRVVDNTLHFQFKHQPAQQLTLAGKLTPSSGRLTANSGPFLVLFTVTDTEGALKDYQPMNGFYVPVYSKAQLIPVDSQYERRVLRLLMQRAQWWHDKHLQACLTKPLFDLSCVVEGETYTSRPDFLVSTPKRDIIFEVMGSHEPDYLARKARTVESMRQLGEVIEFDACAAEQSNQWNTELKRHVTELSQWVFEGNGR